MGRQIWNASKWVKDPDTGNRLRRERENEDKHSIVVSPELRIIDQELWDRVHARPAIMAKRCEGDGHPGLVDRAFSSGYLLSGFLKCGCCGKNLIVTGRGKGKHPR